MKELGAGLDTVSVQEVKMGLRAGFEPQDIIYTPNPGSQGTDQFDYIICDDDNPSLCDTTTVTVFINNQAPGLYTLSLTDSIGCVSQYVINIGSSNSPTVSFTVTDASCSLSNGSVSATPTNGKGPYHYVWSNSDTTSTISGVLSGIYYLTILNNTNQTTYKLIKR